jgi:hypothetical protein
MPKPIILRDSLSLKPKSVETIESRVGSALGGQYVFGEHIGTERGKFLAAAGFTIGGVALAAFNPLLAVSALGFIKVINAFIGARCISNHRNEAISRDLQQAAAYIQSPRTLYLVEEAASLETLRGTCETPRGTYFRFNDRLFYTPTVELPHKPRGAEVHVITEGHDAEYVPPSGPVEYESWGSE